jgi:hypothetical protein
VISGKPIALFVALLVVVYNLWCYITYFVFQNT